MRRYERWNHYPYNTYGAENTVILSGFPDDDWEKEHLLLRPHPRHPQVMMVGCQSYHIEHDHEDKLVAVAICYEDPENKRRVIELLPELVVEADPFGPDSCPACGGPLPEPHQFDYHVRPSEQRRRWWHLW